jgi:hypothetical protein
LKKQAMLLLLFACALVPALAAGIPALAQSSQAAPESTPTTTGGIGTAVFPPAEPATSRKAVSRSFTLCDISHTYV